MHLEPLIKIENVSFRYDGDESRPYALKNISLDIDEGSFVCIIGHNGSGKSTLSRMLNGILLPDEGTVTVAGMGTTDEETILALRSNIGLVFQNPDNQIVASVVEEDVAFAPENLGLPPKEIRKRVDEALKLVDMYEYRLHAPHLLSGGQKQRVAIAGVIAMNPRCIVLDEPTAMLDPSGRREVIETITRLCRESGMTVVLITHHMTESIGADKVYVMSNGEIAVSGTPVEVFSDYETLKSLDLTVPDTTRLILELRDAGMQIPLDALTPEDCAAAIAQQLNS